MIGSLRSLAGKLFAKAPAQQDVNVPGTLAVAGKATLSGGISIGPGFTGYSNDAAAGGVGGLIRGDVYYNPVTGALSVKL